MYIKISCDNICNIGKYSDEALYMRTPVQLKYISHYFRGSVITGLRHQQTEYLVRVPGLLMSASILQNQKSSLGPLSSGVSYEFIFMTGSPPKWPTLKLMISTYKCLTERNTDYGNHNTCRVKHEKRYRYRKLYIVCASFHIIHLYTISCFKVYRFLLELKL